MFAPYPGDEAAGHPLFVYEDGQDWDVYVYFTGPVYYDLSGTKHDVPLPLRRRVASVELLPKTHFHFPAVFPSTFTRQRIQAADAAWDNLTDGSGLCYEIYTDGKLNRIIYGASPTELARLDRK